MSNHETVYSAGEEMVDRAELEAIQHERSKDLREKLNDAYEKHAASPSEKSEVSARHDALMQANNADKSLNTSQETSPAKRRGVITKHQRELSFSKQMAAAQHTMKPAEKQFSKVIHNKTVEKVSDTVGSTIARPNALLTGSIFAFITITVVYLGAKHYGYSLSGFETIGAFIIGWLLGLFYDYVRLLITGKK